MEKVDCVVIGAGIIGLAVARALALAGREVLVLESQPGIGMETSSRNSEVIHAGLYYPQGSLKARYCLAGRDMLFQYCRERGIPHRQCGKLIVATSAAQSEALAAIHAKAQANGCHEVGMIGAQTAQAMEPEVACVEALYSPMTGIIDSHAYMLSLQGDAENAGALFAFGSRVESGEVLASGIRLEVAVDAQTGLTLQARTVLNCAGLWAPRLAAHIAGLDAATLPTAYFAKGNYFSLAGRAPFTRLVYPVPEPGGLGVHLTLDMAGMARFGPDVEWLDEVQEPIDYSVNPARAEGFYAEIRKYWPRLPEAALQPAYSGVRPKISPRTAAAADFHWASHGHPDYLGLYGIESPGLTASLAIAEQVLQWAAGQTSPI